MKDLRNKILIVEDEQRLAEVLQKQFSESGFETEIVSDGYLGKNKITENTYDLVILDINLPLMNGYELCREIRKINRDIPVIMLTAFITPENKLYGFESGADDYVPKPFDFRELLARVKVFLKRSTVGEYPERVLKLADLELNEETKTVKRSGKKIDLTSREFALLEIMLRNKHRLLSREYIIEKVWNIDFDTESNILDVYINYLRKKIDRDFEPKLIHTKFGFGFYCSDNEI